MSQTKHRQTTTLLGEKISYTTTRSTNATQPRIDVGIHGIEVIIPTDSDIDPDTLLTENASWVLDKKTTYDRRREQIPDRRFEPGETWPFLGVDHELVVEPRQETVVRTGTIRLRQSAVNQSSVETALKNCYRRQARDYLTERIDHYAKEMGLEYDGIEIRNQRTRWGSCSTNGTISLNCRLIMAPPEIVDYVVIHELAHLQEPNHTESFWALVSEYDQDYKQHMTWLDEKSTELIFSEEDL